VVHALPDVQKPRSVQDELKHILVSHDSHDLGPNLSQAAEGRDRDRVCIGLHVATQILNGIMVARDGVEPPTPAFSVLHYAVF
jgi:hypothetical protein